MEELVYIPVEEVKPQGRFIKAIGFRPKMAPVICIVAGILLLIINNWAVRALGAFFIMMSVMVLRLVDDYKVIDVFDQGVMIYGDRENKTALFIPFEDIKVWGVSHEDGHDVIMFDLGEKGIIGKDTFEADRAFRALYPLIKDKEAKNVKMREEKGISLASFFNNRKNKKE